jgi:hypothetical protein
MFRDFLSEARYNGWAIRRAVTARVTVAMNGESPVAESCQIPEAKS